MTKKQYSRSKLFRLYIPPGEDVSKSGNYMYNVQDILYYIRDNVDRDGTFLYSYPALAEAADLDPRTFYSYLKAMLEIGWIGYTTEGVKRFKLLKDPYKMDWTEDTFNLFRDTYKKNYAKRYAKSSKKKKKG